jgi:hypothetical protein
MSTSDLINLGILALAFLSTAAAGVYFVYRLLKARYRSLALTIKPGQCDHVYILAMRLRRDQPPLLTRVGTWFELSLYNTGPQPRLVTDIIAEQDGYRPEQVVGPPVKDVEFDFGKETPHETLELPFTLQAQHGIRMWVLAPVIVPERLGEILFALYGESAERLPSFRLWCGRFADAETFILQGVDGASLGIKNVSVNIPYVDLNFPVLRKRGVKLELDPKLGMVPRATHHRVISAALERGWTQDDVLSTSGRYFRISVHIAGGRTLTRRIKVDRDALWWS